MIPLSYINVYLQVMYGGRAIDDFDRRVLRTYMDEYMGDFIFDTFQPFHFYVNETVDYRIPEDGARDNYKYTSVKVINSSATVHHL
jgi:dynein heavy chain